MSRRRFRKGEAALVGLLLMIGLPIVAVQRAAETFGGITVVVAVVVTVGLFVWYQVHKSSVRLAYLRNKYEDEETVQKIRQGRYWHGQTAVQLVDSIGRPVAVDDQLLKTKKREVWKYHQAGANRFRLRITLENDFVTGWDHKRYS